MPTLRLAQFGASVVSSWFAGTVGAFLVWNIIYSIGSRVVTDEIHYQLDDGVTRWGGIAGALVGMAVVLSFRCPAPGVLAAGHALATVAGFVGGSVGWQEGLRAYFGALVTFIICVAFRALFRFLSHREYARTTAEQEKEKECRERGRSVTWEVYQPVETNCRPAPRFRMGREVWTLDRLPACPPGGGRSPAW